MMANMLYGWTMREWAIAIPWARARGIVTGALSLSLALEILWQYDSAYGCKPGEVTLLEAPSRDMDLHAARDLFMLASDALA